MATFKEDRSYQRISKNHLDVLATFMERYPNIALAWTRNRDDQEYTQKKWEEIATALNKIDPNITRSGRNWCKYWSDVKCKIRRRYSRMQKCQLEGLECRLSLTSFQQRMVKVLTDKQGNLYHNKSHGEFHLTHHQTYMEPTTKFMKQPTANRDQRLSSSISNGDDSDKDSNDSEYDKDLKFQKEIETKLNTIIRQNNIATEELNVEDVYLSPAEDSTTEAVSFPDNDINSNTSNPELGSNQIKIEVKDFGELRKELLEFELLRRKELFEIEKKQRREKHELEVSILRLKRDLLAKKLNML